MKNFTLIDLLCVMGITAVLAGIFIPLAIRNDGVATDPQVDQVAVAESTELLIDWATMPNGLFTYRDEKNGYLVYVVAKGMGHQHSPPTTAVFAVPLEKKEK